MASDEQLLVLRQGVAAWNQWRRTHRPVVIDLRQAELRNASLRGAELYTSKGVQRTDLREANFAGAYMGRVDFFDADLSGADFRDANLRRAKLEQATLVGAKLDGADLRKADLRGADLRGASLREANLQQAQLVGTNLDRADLTGSSVYGISVWNVALEGAKQANLVVTPDLEPTITVDNLEVAQFVYLLLNNRNLRRVIDTITAKVALILGRFTPERKAVLDALRGALRRRDYLPILFDFEKPTNRNTIETISTLAHLARFVIADLTDAKSVLQELQEIVPDLPSVPVQPILLAAQHEPGMIDYFRGFRSFLPMYRYGTTDELLTSLESTVIQPAENLRNCLAS